MTRTFKSWRSFWDFNHAVRRKLRYVRAPEHEEFLKTVAETSHSRKVVMKAGFVLWRAQLGHEYRVEKQGDEVFEIIEAAYSPARMKPLPDKAYDGRANPKGIPCLYLATRKETAVSEVRPWIGSYVSVGQFQILRDVELIDCSRAYKDSSLHFWFQKQEPEPAEREKAVWSDIDRAFAEPITRSDDGADYVATQIIAELFKREGSGDLL
jgi:RES domain